jgi:hypothetical protein
MRLQDEPGCAVDTKRGSLTELELTLPNRLRR